MIFKLGVDRSGGQSRYKQKSNESNFEGANAIQSMQSYEQVKDLIKNGYLSQEDYLFSESSAEVNLKSIADLTIKRLCIIQKQIFK